MSVFFRICPEPPYDTCTDRACLADGHQVCKKAAAPPPVTTTAAAPAAGTWWCDKCQSNRTSVCDACNVDLGYCLRSPLSWSFRATERSFQWINPDERI